MSRKNVSPINFKPLFTSMDTLRENEKKLAHLQAKEKSDKKIARGILLVIIIILLISLTSCGGMLAVQKLTDSNYMIRYIELPDTSKIKTGYSDQLYTPCDTVVEFPSRRTFVIKSVKLTRDSVWVNCKGAN